MAAFAASQDLDVSYGSQTLRSSLRDKPKFTERQHYNRGILCQMKETLRGAWLVPARRDKANCHRRA